MSSQRGNIARSRPQKHQNKKVFKNDLHDTSHTIKKINKIEVANVCGHCKGVIEWKIKYKKYKPLKNPSTCTKCHQKCVKEPYHTMCGPCANAVGVCPKCGKLFSEEDAKTVSFDLSFLKDPETNTLIKELSERKRRTFHRFVEKSSSLPNALEIITNKLKDMSSSDGKSSMFDDFGESSEDDDISD